MQFAGHHQSQVHFHIIPITFSLEEHRKGLIVLCNRDQVFVEPVHGGWRRRYGYEVVFF